MSGSTMRLLAAAILLGAVAFVFVKADTSDTEARSEPLNPVAETIPAPAPVKPLWQVRRCPHGHRFLVAHGRIRKLVRNHNPYVNKKRVQHYANCVGKRKMSRKLHRFAKKSREWRQQYAHKWVIKFNSLPASWRNWAISTSSCESGMNPTTATGNGFLGAFQFLPSTWAMAGGTGLPNQHSWHYQAWIAVHWRMRSSQAQWPNCAPW